jgi:hypothetical protein
MALSSLGKLLLDLMNRQSILQIEPELLGSPEMASRAAISRVIPRFSRTMSFDGGRRNTKFYAQPVSGDAHRLRKLLPKNFSRMNCPTRRTLIF